MSMVSIVNKVSIVSYGAKIIYKMRHNTSMGNGVFILKFIF